MTISDKDNSRRAHAAETVRQITSGETAAFFTSLLAVLNETAVAPPAGHHEPEKPAPQPGLYQAHPAAPPPTENAPDDSRHHAEHAGSTDPASAESASTVQVDRVVTQEPAATATTEEATPARASSPVHVESVPIPGPDTSAGHSLHDSGVIHSITSAAPTTDPAAFVAQATDGIGKFIDASIATVSNVISDVGASINQLTSSLSGTINHLTDNLIGLASTLVHDAPVTAVAGPLLSDILGSTQDTTAHSLNGVTHPLLDIAGAVPTAALHPIPLHLGFLGQPTLDGHEPHDAAFSTLGMHHF